MLDALVYTSFLIIIFNNKCAGCTGARAGLRRAVLAAAAARTFPGRPGGRKSESQSGRPPQSGIRLKTSRTASVGLLHGSSPAKGARVLRAGSGSSHGPGTTLAQEGVRAGGSGGARRGPGGGGGSRGGATCVYAGTVTTAMEACVHAGTRTASATRPLHIATQGTRRAGSAGFRGDAMASRAIASARPDSRGPRNLPDSQGLYGRAPIASPRPGNIGVKPQPRSGPPVGSGKGVESGKGSESGKGVESGRGSESGRRSESESGASEAKSKLRSGERDESGRVWEESGREGSVTESNEAKLQPRLAQDKGVDKGGQQSSNDTGSEGHTDNDGGAALPATSRPLATGSKGGRRAEECTAAVSLTRARCTPPPQPGSPGNGCGGRAPTRTPDPQSGAGEGEDGGGGSRCGGGGGDGSGRGGGGGGGSAGRVRERVGRVRELEPAPVRARTAAGQRNGRPLSRGDSSRPSPGPLGLSATPGLTAAPGLPGLAAGL
ncbi:hypothetical protein T492DRAFT_845315 [Pavlovales sp. CCMP2436]|nr:hypothetical protein T492DRAFT_845315 [Pavlovales sp. CCMP2436]